MEKADKGTPSASSRVKSEVSLPPIDAPYLSIADKPAREATLVVKPAKRDSFREHLAKI